MANENAIQETLDLIDRVKKHLFASNQIAVLRPQLEQHEADISALAVSQEEIDKYTAIQSIMLT